MKLKKIVTLCVLALVVLTSIVAPLTSCSAPTTSTEGLKFELNEDGEAPEVSELDDTEIHIMEHTRYVYSAGFRELKRDQPQLAEQLMQHIRDHRTVAQQNAAQAAMAQNQEIEQMAAQKLQLESMTSESMTGGM